MAWAQRELLWRLCFAVQQEIWSWIFGLVSQAEQISQPTLLLSFETHAFTLRIPAITFIVLHEVQRGSMT